MARTRCAFGGIKYCCWDRAAKTLELVRKHLDFVFEGMHQWAVAEQRAVRCCYAPQPVLLTHQLFFQTHHHRVHVHLRARGRQGSSIDHPRFSNTIVKAPSSSTSCRIRRAEHHEQRQRTYLVEHFDKTLLHGGQNRVWDAVLNPFGIHRRTKQHVDKITE
eukprot:1887145-Rhodomonas_salina.2